jgi:restriction system protein
MGKRRGHRARSKGVSLWPLAIVIVAFLAYVVAKRAIPYVEENALPIGLALAAVFVAVALVFVERNRRRYARWVALREVKLLTPMQFEEHVAEFYRQRGFKVTMTPRIGDQGIDVIAEREGRRIGIQCKLYSANVSNDAVQQVLAGKHYYQCSHAVVIASGGFTASAIELAKRSNVELLNGEQYAELVRKLVESNSRARVNGPVAG